MLHLLFDKRSGASLLLSLSPVRYMQVRERSRFDSDNLHQNNGSSSRGAESMKTGFDTAEETQKSKSVATVKKNKR